MTFRWVIDETRGHTLFANDDPIATIPPFASAAITHSDEIVQSGEGVFRWTRRFRAMHPLAPTSGPLTMEVIAPYAARFSLIPAVSYHGNHWGTGQEPKGFRHDGVPWSFAWHRASVPGATYSEGPAWSVALFGAAPPRNRSFSCALIPEAERTIHRLLWPEEERPVVYSGRDHYDPAYAATLALEPGEEMVAVAFLVVSPVVTARTAWHKLLDVAWAQNHHDITPWFSPEELWRLGVRFARESLWAEKGPFQGFATGLVWDGEQWRHRQHGAYEIGWCGQNASLANALLHDYQRTGDTSSRDRGLAVLDSWAARARLDNGLIRCHIDTSLTTASRAPVVENRRTEHAPPVEIQDACNLGGAAVAFFEAAYLATRCGIDRPVYDDIARGICDFVIQSQGSDGQIGRAWANDGRCIDREGTIGSFLVPPLILAYRRSRDRRYLDAAERGYAYYIAGLMRDGFTTAGALDTDCIDKESALPLLTAGLALHEVTHKDVYLMWAEHAAQYLATWQWHHTVSYPPNSALGALHYDTFGGTAVSTQHHHQDPYAVAFVPGWLRLAELTGRDVWRQRALAAWAQGTIGVSDGDLVVLSKRRPPGSQDEGAFHTRWQEAGSVSEWLVAWPTAFRLDVLRTLPDWSILPRGTMGAHI